MGEVTWCPKSQNIAVQCGVPDIPDIEIYLLQLDFWVKFQSPKPRLRQHTRQTSPASDDSVVSFRRLATAVRLRGREVVRQRTPAWRHRAPAQRGRHFRCVTTTDGSGRCRSTPARVATAHARLSHFRSPLSVSGCHRRRRCPIYGEKWCGCRRGSRDLPNYFRVSRP